MLQALRQFFTGSLQRQLITSVALVHAVMMSVFVWDLTVRQQEMLLDQQAVLTQSLAQSVAISAAGWLAARDLTGLQEIIDAQRQHKNLAFAMVLDRDGLVLAHTDRLRRGQYVLDLPAQVGIAMLSRSAGLVDVVAPAFVGDSHVGWVRIGLSQHDMASQLATITRDGVIYALVAIFVGMLIAAYAGKRLTARLKIIQSAADDVKSGKSYAHAVVKGSDEAAILAAQFNAMLDAIAQREQLLKQAQEMAHLGSWELDLQNNRLTWSDEVYQIFGLLPQEFPATYEAFLASVHPDDRAPVDEAYQSSLREHRDRYEIEHRIIRRTNGEIRHVHEKCQHIRNDQGKIIRSVGMVHDISELKLATQELERSRDYLQHLFEFVPDAILSMDEQQRILSFNASAELLFGYAAAEIVGRPLDILLPASMRAQHQEYVNTFALEKHKARTMGSGLQISGRRKDGTEVALEVSLSKLTANGGIVFLATARDISERIRQEQERARLQGQLLQAQKMESIGQLTGGIAHDFNNMLGAIMGYAELLRLTADGEDGQARRHKYIGEIMNAGNRAKELIAHMLIFSRQRADAQQGEVPVILLQPLLKEMLQMLRASIPSTVELAVLVEEPGLQLRIHPVQLQQIVLNLAINARDAMAEYGRIEIAVKTVAARGNCQSCHQDFAGEFVELSVTDSGQGMAEDVLGKIFEPFFSTKEVGKGTGMGLAVVHGIVHAAGGHITVQSRPRLGTRVSVVLPLAASAAPAGQADPPPAAAARNLLDGMRILLVDDERVMVAMLEELLTLHGAQVDTYTQSAAALADFMRQPEAYDLVITDETMPELTGLDMARIMRQARSELPVILCTGYSERVDPQIARQHGIAAFMYKPVNVQLLLEQVQLLVGK